MPVFVRRKARSPIALASARVRPLAEKMLRSLRREHDELSILLTDDAFIRTLNRDHRGKDRPTDVLAFPLDEALEATPFSQPGAPREIGDVVISLDTAARQARRRKHALLDEVAFLLAHGILHLYGYDHQTDRQEAEMNALTRELVNRVRRSSGSGAGLFRR